MIKKQSRVHLSETDLRLGEALRRGEAYLRLGEETTTRKKTPGLRQGEGLFVYAKGVKLEHKCHIFGPFH